MRVKKIFTVILMVVLILTSFPTGLQADTLPTDLFFSEYIEGGSYNKAIEIYNGTGNAVNLDEYSVELYNNGATVPNYTEVLSDDDTTQLANGDVFVIAHGSALPTILAESDMTSSVANFNGDDVLILKHGDTIIDAFGQIGVDPGTAWGSDGDTTIDHTLVRKNTVQMGDYDPYDVFEPSLEWDFYPQDTFEYLGSHTIEAVNYISIATAKTMTSGDEVTVRGYVTDTNKLFIQDETAGTALYSQDDTTPIATGDFIEVTGTIGEYRGLFQIEYFTVETISSGHTVTPIHVEKINEIDESLEGQLIKLSGVEIGAINTGGITTFTDSTGTINSYQMPQPTSDIVEGVLVDVVAIVSQYYSSYQLYIPTSNNVVLSADQQPQLPIIYNESPANMSEIFDTMPEISAVLDSDFGAVDKNNIKLQVDNVEVNFTLLNNRITYTPDTSLGIGEHDVVIEISDNNGQVTTKSWYFHITNPMTTYDFYYGVPHSHTSYSDGKGTPMEAYEYAYNNDLDFLIVTDHSNWLDGVVDEGFGVNYEYDAATDQYIEKVGTEWYNTRIQAENFNAAHDDFLALRGFEMTSSSWGHSNPINTDNYVEAKSQMTSLSDYYEWVQEQDDSVAAFNHPNWPDDSFYDFNYVPEADKMLSLIEVGNGAPPYSYVRAEEHYFKALDNGWHVGAINGQDNHSTNWGDPDNLTVVISESLEEEDFIDALLSRRVYSTETRTLELTFKGNDHWMGSVLDVDIGDTIEFNIEAYDQEVKIDKIQLITNGGNILETKDITDNYTANWNFNHIVDGSAQWYIVKIIHENGKWGTSSPIFTPVGEYDVKLASLEVYPEVIMENTEAKIEVAVENNGIRDVENVEVKLYKNSVAVSNLIATTEFDSLLAGEKEIYQTTWVPDDVGEARIIAKMTVIPGITTVTELSKTINIVPHNGRTVMIDDSHNNVDVMGAMLNFVDLLRLYGYQVIINTETITASTLENIDVLVINTPSSSNDFTTDEEEVIGQWVKNGGSAMFAAKSNYNNDSTLMNSLLENVGTNIRFNDDNIYEPEDSDKYSGGMVWSIYSYNLPETNSGVNDNMEAIRVFSSASLVNDELGALTNDPNINLEIILGGNATSYNAYCDGYVYNEEGQLDGESIPIIATQEVQNGRVCVAGRHFYSDFEIVNDVSNTALTLNLVDWLANYERIQTIEEVRTTAQVGDRVTVKGTVTVPTSTFFDVIYIQDETSGISLYGNYQDKKYLAEGTEIVASGVVQMFEGEMEIVYDNFDYNLLYVGEIDKVIPTETTAQQSMDSDYTGMLLTTKGKITEINDAESYFIIRDETGTAYVHVDGYVGVDMGQYSLGTSLRVTGIASIGSNGPRIRVRWADDIEEIEPGKPIHDIIPVRNGKNAKIMLSDDFEEIIKSSTDDVIIFDATINGVHKNDIILESYLLRLAAEYNKTFIIKTNLGHLKFEPMNPIIDSKNKIRVVNTIIDSTRITVNFNTGGRPQDNYGVKIYYQANESDSWHFIATKEKTNAKVKVTLKAW